MLKSTQLKTLQDLIAGCNREELLWINGYLNGVVQGAVPAAAQAAPGGEPAVSSITILYGTETGNAKRLANEFALKAKQHRIRAKVQGMDQYRLTDLTREEYLLAVISTHGDGEPPAAAKKFYDHLHHHGFRLDKLRYGVLALGDSAYPLFCKTGEEVDLQLQKLGGQRLVPLQKCDVDFDADAGTWFSNVLQQLTGTAAAPAAARPAAAVKKGKQGYAGTVLTHINLNDRGSARETWHIEIRAEGIAYECGDSIGVVPENNAQLVTDIIARVNVDGNKVVAYKNEKHTLCELLKHKVNIEYLTEKQVQQYGRITGQEIPVQRAGLLDLLSRYPVQSTAQFEEVLAGLNALAPRLYTIASAPSVHADEVHILVLKDQFNSNGQTKIGLCSAYLGGFEPGRKLYFFVQPNRRFRLPAEDKDIIMVGPGTGIAAFRSFLAERDATGATGRNWLFFGEQRFTTDFLYQTEIQQWHQSGVLNKISLAFSRDQAARIYVQHRMLEQAAELYQWLENGAYFYVCGRKEPMSTEVEQTLLRIVGQEGGMSPEAAREYLERLEEEGRYEKDVY